MLIDPYEIRAFRQERPLRSGLHRVRPAELKLRRVAANFARYLQLQQHYDFPTFDVNSHLGDLALYLFGYGGWWVGAFCFLSLADRDTSRCGAYASAEWLAAWCWLHPNVQRRGLLTEAWPQLEAMHGQFPLQAPLSPAMESFARKLGVDEDRVVLLGRARDR